MATTRFRRPMFFQQEDVTRAIERLAQVDHLVIVAGAGVSVQSGLPTWDELSRSTIDAAAASAGLDLDQMAALRSSVERSGHQLHRQSLVQAYLEGGFTDTLRRCLYSPSNPRTELLVPGALARSIARLARTALGHGVTVEVATTNYDDLLERALKRELTDLDIRVKSDVTGVRSTDRRMQVHHLHGLLTERTHKGDIVWGETEYLDDETGSSWQESLFADWLRDPRVGIVVVGSSLHDPNLLRYFYRYGRPEADPPSGAPIIALLPASGSPTEGLPEARTHEVLDEMEQRRWAALGVQTLLTDWFNQSSQFVAEVQLAIEQGERYEAYPTRLEAWYTWFRRELGADDHELFPKAQRVLSRAAREAVNQIRDYAGIDDSSDEVLVLQVWTRYPPRRELALTFSSDREWTNRRVVDHRTLTTPNRITAVEAFCAGMPVVRTTNDPQFQWQSVRAFPIVLHRGSDRLTVGAAMIGSTYPEDLSALGRLPIMKLDAITRDVNHYLVGLLTPDTVG